MCVLRLRRNDKKVGWSEDTVDNEGMDRKKSKCCCVYKKPMQFGESSSETDDECENCYGHVEVKKKHIKKRKKKGGGGSGDDDDEAQESDKARQGNGEKQSGSDNCTNPQHQHHHPSE